MKIKATIFSLVIALAFAAFATGCAPSPTEIEDVVICKNVDSDYKPLEPTSVFPLGTTDIVWASVKIKNMTSEDKITTKWNYLETKELIDSTDFITETAGSGYVGFSLTVEKGFPEGRYNAVIFLNDVQVETVEFSVE
ncbi:MAG: hypothetical protein U9O59_00695 [Actinomycetota bacterium]|nr:hypothetical protein [Actinomycetota bacterium]